MSFFKIKPLWKVNSKHKKLSEDATLKKIGKEVIIEPENEATDEAENDVVTFKLKYLGSTMVDKNSTTIVDKSAISSEAVKQIIKTAKSSRKQQKKLEAVMLTISPKEISVTNLNGKSIFEISLYRVSNCASDSTHRQVFSFISTDEKDKTECHAFFCSKKKLADTVCLTVGKFFSTAYEAWKELPEPLKRPISRKEPEIIEKENNVKIEEEEEEAKLIDFESEAQLCSVEDDDWEFDMLSCSRNNTNNNNNSSNQWVSFEDDFSKARTPSQISSSQRNLILV